jgi:AraC-like DNA-binding protein
MNFPSSSHMKAARSFEPHLVINEITLPRSAEWMPQLPGWSFIQVIRGAGYWWRPSGAVELSPGSALVITGEVRGILRASQLSDVLLAYFCVDLEKLSGLLSLGEQRALKQAATKEQFGLRVLPPSDRLTERFNSLYLNQSGSGFSLRLQLLQLFTDLFECALKDEAGAPQALDGRGRLRQFLKQVVASELMDLSLADLAPKMHCTPRHLSRLFREEVGMSFQEKQTELRLRKACQLLTSTSAKIIDVGSASGYQSNSLFGLMFKKRFGMSPGKWRERHVKKQPERQRVVRMLNV